VTFASGLDQPEAIAVDGTDVYFATLGDNAVNHVSAGGAVTTLATGQSGPNHVAVDSTYVYWSSGFGNAIVRQRRDGQGTFEIFATTLSPSGLALDSAYVYWLSAEPCTLGSSGGGLWKALKAGGSAVCIGAGSAFPGDVVIDASGTVYGPGGAAAIQGDVLYSPAGWVLLPRSCEIGVGLSDPPQTIGALTDVAAGSCGEFVTNTYDSTPSFVEPSVRMLEPRFNSGPFALLLAGGWAGADFRRIVASNGYLYVTDGGISGAKTGAIYKLPIP
jgi:hypothetical protein